MRFFLDNNISKAMAIAIASLVRSQGHEVTHLTDLFTADTPDTVWIAAIKDAGYTIVSGDPRITRNPANREAWRESGLTAFFLSDNWSERQFWVQAAELVRWFPIIIQVAKNCAPGSGFLLPFKGSVPKPIYMPPTPPDA